MAKKGKKYVDSAKLIDRAAQYDVNEAMELVIKTATAKFDETVELHVKLGVDSRHADQQVRGAIVLPHGTGKTQRVLVFAKAAKADEAKAAGAAVVGTGRSDFPNQVNNVIAFPGIFKGALQARAERITEPMKLAAAKALAALVPDDELSADFIIPDPFDPRAADAVAEAVRACAGAEKRG